MVAIKSMTLALLGLTATATAAPSNTARQAGVQCAVGGSDCNSGWKCQAIGPIGSKTGVCIPEKTSKRTDSNPPPLEYPGCGGNSTCPSTEFCYKPGPSDWPYGVCMPKGSTSKRQVGVECAVGGTDCNSGWKCQAIGPIGSKTGVCIPSKTKRADNPPPLEYPGCGADSTCKTSEFCYKPGPSDWPYGVCMPKGSTSKRAESNPPPLEYPGCGGNSTCHSNEFCYKPGPSDWPYGVCMLKGSTSDQ